MFLFNYVFQEFDSMTQPASETHPFLVPGPDIFEKKSKKHNTTDTTNE